MKAYLHHLIADALSPLIARHYVREYLQARILQSLQRAGAMQSIAFHGGTALRFLYGIPRYSEDLDFALERAGEIYDFKAYLRAIEQDFAAEAYTVEIKVNDKRVVHKAFVRFRGLLHELGLSPHLTEVLSINVEIDTNPPAGATLATTPIQRHVALNLMHHDQDSLIAGKLNAILQRPYTKGRDIYDLWWYLSQPDWPAPNLIHLNQGLIQTGWTGEPLTPDNWRSAIRQRIIGLHWPNVVEDVEFFIIDANWQGEFRQASLVRMLSS